MKSANNTSMSNQPTIQTLIQEKEQLCCQLNTINQKLIHIQDKIDLQKKLLLKTEEPEYFVTDHAVIRYMERKLNININDFKKELVKDHINTILFMQNGKIQTNHGILVIQHHKIVTII